MKKLTILLSFLTIFSLTSCRDNFKVSNPQKETTLEVQNSIDTSQVFFVVENKDNLYVLNQNKEVVYKANTKDEFLTFIIGVLIGLFLYLLVVALSSTNI